jgi:hypothetical protein
MSVRISSWCCCSWWTAEGHAGEQLGGQVGERVGEGVVDVEAVAQDLVEARAGQQAALRAGVLGADAL